MKATYKHEERPIILELSFEEATLLRESIGNSSFQQRKDIDQAKTLQDDILAELHTALYDLIEYGSD